MTTVETELPDGPRSAGKPRPTVSAVADRARTWGNRLGFLGLALIGIYPLLTDSPTLIRQFVYIGIFAMVAIGLNFTLGFAGEFALGQAGVFAAGAYTSGILTAQHGWPFWAAMLASIAVACAIGLAAGLPGLRIGGWYFALTSLFVAVVLPELAIVFPGTGGVQGFGNIPFPSFFSVTLDFQQIYGFILVSTVIFLLLLHNLVRSRWGIAFMSMRHSNKFAESSGVAVFRMKLMIYLMAAVTAGYAGALLPAVAGYLAPDAFPLSLSILLIAGVTIGGMGTLAGPVVGVALLQMLPEQFSNFDQYSLLIYGSILILMMIFLRRGILPTASDLWVTLVVWVARRRGWVTEDHEADATVLTTPGHVDIEHVQASGPLTVRGVQKSFFGLQALSDVSVTAAPGQITAVIGPNGSGKTTLLNIILGFYRLDAGSVRLADERLSGRKPFQVARRGVARTFQTPVIMRNATCRENVMSGSFIHRRVTFIEVLLRLPRARRDMRVSAAQADQLLAFVGLARYADTPAGSLTAGQQRLLDVARALAVRPAAILLDEPAAGLVGNEVEALATVLRALRASGYIVVLVEHNINLVMAVADRVAVLDRGTCIADGDPETVQKDPAVLRCYLGRSHA